MGALMRIVLGKIDAVPAAGGLMAIKVQANTGSVYEIMVDPKSVARFVEAIEVVRAGWTELPRSGKPPSFPRKLPKITADCRIACGG